MITKEIIDNLSHEDTLLLLRTTSNDKVFYNDVIKGKTLIENIRFELNTDRVHFANGYKFLASYPHHIKIMIYAKVGDPYTEKWTWTNSVYNRSWDWFYATYYLLINKHYTHEELYVMSEIDTINNYKIQVRDNKLISIGI
jgi:hypothetical protein